jgi:hypothetical protein
MKRFDLIQTALFVLAAACLGVVSAAALIRSIANLVLS